MSLYNSEKKGLEIIVEPERRNGSEWIFAPGDNVNLTCSSDEDIVAWRYEEVTYMGTEERFEKDNIQLIDSLVNDTYSSKLLVYAVTDADIGSYTCVPVKNDTNGSKSVYIYVSDNKTPLFWDRKMDPNYSEFVDLVVPCRPTQPHVEPKLNFTFGEDNEVTVGEDNKNGVIGESMTMNITFDKSEGFKFKRAQFKPCRKREHARSYKISFKCYYGDFNISQEIEMYCRRISLNADVTQAYYPVEGSNVSLTCSATDPFQDSNGSWMELFNHTGNIPFKWSEFSINWIYLNNERNHSVGQSPQITSTLANGTVLLSRNLTFSNLSKSNRGNYVCQVTDRLSEYRETTPPYYLAVWDPNDKFIYVNMEDGVDEKTVKKGQQVAWRMNVTAYPPPVVKWKRKITQEDVVRDSRHSFSFDGRFVDLIIRKIEEQDQDPYGLAVFNQDDSKYVHLNLRVVGVDEGSYLNLFLHGSTANVTKNVTDRNFKWEIRIESNPRACIRWMSPTGAEIDSGSSVNDKYVVVSKEHETTLEIRNLQVEDSGGYVLNAFNGLKKSDSTYWLSVQDRPKVSISEKNVSALHRFDRPYTVECVAKSVPKLDYIKLYFINCKGILECNGEPDLLQTGNITKFGNSTYEWKVDGTFRRLENTRKIICSAKNVMGTNVKNDSYILLATNIIDDSGLVMEYQPSESVVNDNITLTCTASKYYFLNNVSWFHDDIQLPLQNQTEGQGRIKVRPHRTLPGHSETNYTEVFGRGEYDYFHPPGFVNEPRDDLSYTFTFQIWSATKNHSGNYRCQVPRNKSFKLPGHEDTRSASTRIVVQDFQKPKFESSNWTDVQSIPRSETEKKLNCTVSGYPRPEIVWYKDGQPLNKSDGITITGDNQILTISNRGLKEDSGNYTCEATSKNTYDSRSTRLEFQSDDENGDTQPSMLIVLLILLLVMIVACITMLALRIHKDRKFSKELTAAGLMSFQKGAVSSLNPELNIYAQADLLPYDRRFEFPIKNLKLGKQLGSGAFGTVMKAEAVGLRPKNEITIVAVKMLPQRADLFQVKALAAELKIMIYLGRNLNVVNLLGACTRNIDKRQLCVVIEYCKYGNLRDFILKQRGSFIDQIDPETGQIDSSISARKKGDVPATSDETTVEGFRIGSSGFIVPKDPEAGEEDLNYCQGDYEGISVQPIKTTDLICWSFQITRGMEFLASRKVLHGDLAARNILLADDYVVKICDFGLAKNMYYSENYKTKDSALLPVRWLALEAIRDRVFSVQSDVWSFGITMWELFSLSVVPYPDIQQVDTLYVKLAKGYRLEKPEFATETLHGIMLDCWNERSTQRPTFSDLAERLGNLLSKSVTSYYLSLSDTYVRDDATSNHAVDYLGSLSDPVCSEATELQYTYLPRKESNAEEEVKSSFPKQVQKIRKLTRTISQLKENLLPKSVSENTDE